MGTAARVIVAEDNPRLAGMVAEALRLEGYRVTVAVDGESALRLVVGGNFDALVTDLDMPGLRGDVLAARVRRLDGALPVVLMTAAPESEAATGSLWTAVLPKPFTLASLVDTVSRALATR